MNQTLSIPQDYQKIRAARRRFSMLPSMPWVELFGLLIMIALAITTSG